MKEIDYIVGIYHHYVLNPSEQLEPYYYLLYLLDEKGMLELEGARDLYKEKFLNDLNSHQKVPQNIIGPFITIESLNQYAFALCEELNAAQINLLSVTDYNSLLENHQVSSDFQRDLLEKGNIIENIERKKKGFLSRFFK